MASGSGLNWRLYGRLSAAVAAIALILVLLPTVQCAVSTVGAAELPDSVEGQAEAAEAVVGADDGLFSRVGRNLGDCTARNPVTGAPLWQLAGLGLGLVFFGVFTVLGRIDRNRSVRIQTKKQRHARKQLRKERSTMPTGSEGFEAVSAPVPSANPTPAENTGGYTSLLDDGEADPLAALDREIKFRESGDMPVVPGPPAPESPPPVDSPRDASSDELPSIEELTSGAGGWDPFDNDSSEVGQLDLGHADTDLAGPPQVSPAPEVVRDTAPNVHRPFPMRSDAAVELSGASFVAPVYVGSDIALEIEGTSLVAAADQLQISLTLESSDGRRTPVWTLARTLTTAGSFREIAEGVKLQIPWRSFGGVLLEQSRDEGIAVSLLHVTLTLGTRTTRVTSPVRDSFVAEVTNDQGRPSEPRTVLVTSASGRVVRGWIGATKPGRLEVPDVEPGSCTIEFDDGSMFSLPGDTPSRSVQLSTAGAGFATPTEGPSPSAAYSLTIVEPAVVYVSARGTEDSNGTRSRPYKTLGEALNQVAARRALGEPEYTAAEIRVDPTASLPSSRPGILSPGPQSQWLRWWRGEPADQNSDWLRNDKLDLLRAKAADNGYLGFHEELVLNGLQDIRIVNSAYADLRDRIARTPGFETRLAAEYGDIPLVLLGVPDGGPVLNTRIQVKDCSRVLFEGIHVLGCVGQSGVVIRDSQAVTLRRCWIDLFSSGSTTSAGVFGVGRGVQIDHSGGDNPNTAIRIEHCDIGWNHAARRSVPIRGAGVALYDSNAELIRCYVHHNRATQAPADLVAQGSTSVRGEACVREDNRVLTL